MPIKSRVGLKAAFRNGSIPSGDDFANLIDSMLNMRDDKFFGIWQPNRAYRNGDVVLYGKSIYQLLLEDTTADECVEDMEGGEEKQTTPHYCNSIPPNEDANWCELELQVEDDDWRVYPNEDGNFTKDSVMLAKVYGAVGIGLDCETDTPDVQARLEVRVAEEAQYLIHPNGIENPTIQINRLNGEDDTVFLKTSLASEQVRWISNAPLGFLLKQINTIDNEDGTTSEEQLHLMLVTSKDNRPRVGIGTDEPQAALDIRHGDNAQLLALLPNSEQPCLVLRNLNSATSYLASSVEADHALIMTDAENGLRFGKGEPMSSNTAQKKFIEAWMSLLPNGKVGIGTETPSTKLEVTDGESGSFKMNLRNTNPAFCITNLRPNRTYVASGVDNDRAIFITDSPDGFHFLAGSSCEENANNECNINQGNAELLVSITPEKKVGIGSFEGRKPQYELDVYGKIRSFGMYMDTNTDHIDETGEVNTVLEDLKKLRPIYFKWKEGTTNCHDEGTQVGFSPTGLMDLFPELVRKNEDSMTYSIAYQNMVAILTKAIQEQQKIIEEQKDAVEKLEKRVKELEEKCEE